MGIFSRDARAWCVADEDVLWFFKRFEFDGGVANGWTSRGIGREGLAGF